MKAAQARGEGEATPTRGRRARPGPPVAEVLWPVLIAVLAVTTRLAFACQYAGHPLGRVAWVDEGAYLERALAICAGAWLPPRPYYQDPLFAYALAGLVALAGPDVARLRVVLACLGSLTPLAVYWAGRRGLGRAEAVAAAALAAVCGPWVFADGQLEKEGLAALCAALALVATASASASKGSHRRFATAGLAWGGVALLRANALTLAPLGAVWAGAVSSHDRPRRDRVAARVGYLAGFAAALAPVTLVNTLTSRPRQFILTTWQAGANFYIGNGPEATGTYAAPEFVEANPAFEADDFAREASRRAGRRLSETEVSRFWFRAGLEHWRRAPAQALRLLGWKLALLANDREVPDNQDFEGVRLIAAPRLGWAFVSFGVLLPLAALGLARSERGPFWWFLVATTATGLATTAAFFVVGRYRVPWLPGLSLLAGSGLVHTIRAVAERRWGTFCGRLAVLGVPATLAAWWPLPDPAPERWGHQEIALALAYLSESHLAAAVDAFDDARALGPGPAARVSGLLAAGPVHDRVAGLINARQRLSAAFTTAPDVERARWERQAPETRDQGRQRLNERLRANPRDRAARRELGAWWLGDTDDPAARERARDELTHAAAGASPDFSASILLALLTRDPSRLPAVPTAGSLPQLARLRAARAALSAAK